MLWLSRPPVVRPILASLIVLTALGIEMTPKRTALHPFATTDVPAGSQITAADVEFREVPEGLLEPVDLPVTVSHPVRAGEPLFADHPLSHPRGWWALELPAPRAATPGTPVRVVITRGDVTESVEGLVVFTGDDPYGVGAALVAVPESWADLVAAAAAMGGITVMVGR